jgi:hypothetical protein
VGECVDGVVRISDVRVALRVVLLFSMMGCAASAPPRREPAAKVAPPATASVSARPVSLPALATLVAPPRPSAALTSAAPTVHAPDAYDALLAMLPAVTPDGARVAAMDDGSEDSPVALQIFSTETSARLESVVLEDPAHPDVAGREDRIAKARALLDRSKWIHLEEYLVSDDQFGPMHLHPLAGEVLPTLAHAEGLTILFREPVVSMVRDGGKELWRKLVPDWSAGEHPACPGCDPCPSFDASISQVWGSRALGVWLVSVRYGGGTDICSEPRSTLHVIRISPPP